MRSGHHERCSNPSLALKELPASSAATASPCPEAPGRQEEKLFVFTSEVMFTPASICCGLVCQQGLHPNCSMDPPGSFDAGGESVLIPVCVVLDDEMDPEMMSYFL